MDLPTIHLDCKDEEKEAQTLRAACMDIGFFVLAENDIITPELLARTFAASASFFALSWCVCSGLLAIKQSFIK